MGYFRAKSDLAFMKAFHEDVRELWRREDENASWQHPNPRYLGPRPDLKDDPEYQEVRERVAKGMTRAVGIGAQLRVPVGLISYPQGQNQTEEAMLGPKSCLSGSPIHARRCAITTCVCNASTKSSRSCRRDIED